MLARLYSNSRRHGQILRCIILQMKPRRPFSGSSNPKRHFQCFDFKFKRIFTYGVSNLLFIIRRFYYCYYYYYYRWLLLIAFVFFICSLINSRSLLKKFASHQSHSLLIPSPPYPYKSRLNQSINQITPMFCCCCVLMLNFLFIKNY